MEEEVRQKNQEDKSMNLKDIYQMISELSHHGGCTCREYEFLCKHVYRRRPCNFLVFGMGHDSDMWLKCNHNGRTVFLENLDKWIEWMKMPEGEIYKVKYTTIRKQWKKILHNKSKLRMDLPKGVLDCKWDVVFVDAPQGFKSHLPGRMQSIFAASQFSKNGADVFVHDMKRRVERVYSKTYLGKPTKIVHHLGYWRGE